VAVLSSPGVSAYGEALKALQRGLGEPAALIELGQDPAGTLSALRATRAQVVVAIGSAATGVAMEAGVPVISTMVLDADSRPRGGQQNEVARISLDVPPGEVLRRIRRMFPGFKRIAVIRPLGGSPDAELLREAAATGVTVEIVESRDAGDLLKAVASLRGRVDAIWCLPDSQLYSPASLTALITATVRGGLPLIGFSEGFVKAGALVGFYPDYADVGAQTAAATARYLQGQLAGRREAPRKVKAGVNERISRILGIGFDKRAAADVEVFK
jgi:ABC-type uncharacterized transport system substrate-binding protein